MLVNVSNELRDKYGADQKGSALDVLENRKEKFFLTGSHFFGTDNEASDLDLLVVDSAEIRKLLKQLGFRLLRGSVYVYSDASITAVYVHCALRIHIQLLAPFQVNAKLCVQSILKKYDYLFNDLSKLDKCAMWNMLLSAYSAVTYK